jgi:hypothetical protein
MRRWFRSISFAVGAMAIGVGTAVAQSPASAGAVPAAPAAPSPPPSPASPSQAPAVQPDPPRAVTIRSPVTAKPCVSATRKLEREKSSLDTAEADVARYRKLEQGCHSKLTCARYAAALAWLDKRVDRHQRRIERFDKGRKDACDGT